MQFAFQHRLDRRIGFSEAPHEQGRRRVVHLGGGLTHFPLPFASLATRAVWRPPSHFASKKTFSASRATSVPIRRWPNTITLASLCSRDRRAEVTSCTTAARTLGF